MRKLGYVLLLFGFAWISFQQMEWFLRGGLRPVVLAQYAKLSPAPSQTYSREEVQLHIRETAIATYRMYPHIITPGFLMLVGGLLLARSGRSKSGHNGP